MADTLGSKTRYWAEQVCPPGLTFTMRARAQDGNSYIPYFWAKVYRLRDKGKLVFFTVGVDANDNALDYKIDRQSKACSGGILDTDQEEKYQEVIQRHRVVPQYVEANNLPSPAGSSASETLR